MTIRCKVYQRTELEHTNPPPQFFDIDENQFEGQLVIIFGYAAAEGVRTLLASEGPNAPDPDPPFLSGIAMRRMVCTHPDIAGDIVIEFPSKQGYLSDQRSSA